MLNKISRIFFGNKDKPEQAVRPRTELSRRSEKPSQVHGSNAVDSFLSSIKGVGHPEYPILDKQYSPGSRIPCTDLVPFISKLIIEGDITSIKIVMRAVIEGNPGLGIGPGWVDGSIDNILSIPFANYISFPLKDALPELKALFIVSAKGGGGREFLITEEVPRLMSWACIAHHPTWSTQLYSLSKKENSWIAKKAKPASCITFLSEQAFAPQNTRFWSRRRVWFQFTVGEDKPPMLSVDNRGKGVLSMDCSAKRSPL